MLLRGKGRGGLCEPAKGRNSSLKRASSTQGMAAQHLFVRSVKLKDARMVFL